MRVRAVQRGFYKWMRHPGEEFELPDELFTPYVAGAVDGGWCERVEEPAPEAPAPDADADPSRLSPKSKAK